MSLSFLKYLVLAVAVVAAIVAVVVFSNRGSHLRLEAKILKVRLVPAGEEGALAVLETRIENPSKVQFLVREARLKVTLADGTELTGDHVAQIDLERVLDFVKLYGPRYNPVIKAKDRIEGGTRADWTVVASFNKTPAALEQRKSFTVEVEDVDGAIARFAERDTQSK